MNGRKCYVCYKALAEDDGIMIEGDGIVTARKEVLQGRIRACFACEKEIAADRYEAQFMFKEWDEKKEASDAS